MQPSASKSRGPKIVSLIISLLILLGFVCALWQWRAILDWARLRNYQAPAEIVELADTTTMTDQARRLFYVYHPELNGKEAFNQHCTNREQTIVLGCYVSNRGIYLYDVQDPRLQGIKQVTAAHEMLHVGYERLSSSERQKVDALLQQAYDNLQDERIRANVESYRAAGADVMNELHSILGTEVADLSPELEAYYARYFTNRAQVVAYANSYSQEFTSRKTQVAQYDAQLSDLKAQIDANEASLGRQANDLASQRQQLDNDLNSGNYASYNANVPRYNAAVQRYNTLLQETRNQIAQYNTIVNQRNKVALEEQDLVEALDSRANSETTR